MKTFHPYQKFAPFYDSVYGSGFYKNYAVFIFNIIKKYGLNNLRILDLACGTGRLIYQLRQRKNFSTGTIFVGVDASVEMLIRARKANPSVRFFHQSFTGLDLNKKYNVIICTFDAINYLTSKADLTRAFRRISKHLVPDGIFIFDFNTLNKRINRKYVHKNATYESRKVVGYWTTIITIKEKKGIFQERHRERLYSLVDIKQALNTAGMNVSEIFQNFHEKTTKNRKASRLIVVAKKLKPK